ncbi:MAG: Mur ligase domain-containing protein [Kiritimatiellia bacterium]
MRGKRIHLVGIGGVGMAGLAVLLKARGHAVSGCDLKPTARTRWLEAQGIPVAFGHSPDHVRNADETIVTPAVRADHPELLAAAVVRRRGEVLAELVSASDGIAVCGSHGKTTTATWIAKLLRALGEDVSWCIGGETGDFPVAGVGRGPLVVEADESDGTLARYRAQTLVVNKCEYDHPDHFKTEADYFACYEAAKRNAGTTIESEALDLGLFDGANADRFACVRALPLHNRRNARAAVEVALRRGHALAAVAAALPAAIAELPDRRFQVVYPPGCGSTVPAPSRGPVVITDYAHHPTELACAVQMARQACGGVLRVLFQPHRHSRTRALLADFPAAFAAADEVVLCPTYAAFEPPVEGGDVADLYRACRAAFGGAKRLYLSRSCREAWEHARNSMAAGDVTLLLGAGDIIDLVPSVCADLAAPRPAPRRIWIGQGANTWRSDLNLSVEYVRTRGPADRPGAMLGIPWMAGIPGTVGGWIKMNAGAFGHSISEVLAEVKVDGRWLPAAACGFAYRHSAIAGEIQDFRLRDDAVASLAAGPSAADYLARRRKFPAGTYGSCFKNPPGDYAGRLLEAAGAKELRVGGAFVWPEHANVIVRGDGATASDVLALARLMRNRVFFRFGVALEPEVCGLEC